jgi:hypothetical protein
MNNDFWPAPGAAAKIRGGWFMFSSRTISRQGGRCFCLCLGTLDRDQVALSFSLLFPAGPLPIGS